MTVDELLGQLQKAGHLDEATAGKLKREAFLSGKSVEDLIHERRLLGDEDIARFKSDLLKIPYQKIEVASIDPKLFELIPEETAQNYGVAPVSRKDNLLVVGMLHPDETKAQEALRFIAKRNQLNLGVYVMSYGDWQAVLSRYSPYRGTIAEALQLLNLKSGSGQGRKVTEIEGGVVAKEEAPIIRIVAETFREAIQSQASDVHIEPQENYLRVRFRNDGDLHEVASLPIDIAPLIISRIKVISDLKIDESRIPQDGRFRSRVFDREIDFRVATFPTPLGEKVAIRILDPSIGLRSFDTLALQGRNRDIMRRGLEKPYGMILVTGPTGSGKTTTLYALLQTLNRDDVNIVSLEDPVEYFISGLNQSQVRPEIGYDFASGLRQILRQDPDVIMVGEIRDNETAALAVHAALTGHIVLSTLHTNGAVGVIPRLIDMKVEPFLLPSAINVLSAQRLISALCQECKAPEEAPAQVQTIIEHALIGVPKEMTEGFSAPYKVYKSPGCDACHGKGVSGRLALYELFEMTPELEQVINNGPTAQKILSEAKRQGMLTLRQDGVLRALQGLVGIEEVVRETEE